MTRNDTTNIIQIKFYYPKSAMIRRGINRKEEMKLIGCTIVKSSHKKKETITSSREKRKRQREK